MTRKVCIPAVATFGLLAGVLCFARNSRPSMGTVSLRLLDAATGRDIPGLVRITDAKGQNVRPTELLSRGRGRGLEPGANPSSQVQQTASIQRWSVVDGPIQIHLPAGRHTFEAISGLETEACRQSVTVGDGQRASCSLRLARFSDVHSHGWLSGNTHLHLARLSRAESDRYLAEVPRADGLDLLFVSYLERAGADQTYVSNGYSKADLLAIGRRSGVRFGNGEEHRHNFDAGGEGYGHVMFLNLRELVEPVSLGPGITKAGTDGMPLRRGIDAARRQRASVIWCHNDWGRERIANVVSGRLDAQNIFDGSIRNGYAESFYRDLNAGFRTAFSTGTDWFLYDFSRVYVLVRGERTVDNWLKSLAEGRTFITNGPVLDLTVAGRTPGEVVRLEKAGQVHVEARGVGRTDFGPIELVQNGRVTATARATAAGGHFEATISLDLDIGAPGWLALRTPPPPADNAAPPESSFPKNELGRHLFAHTSAIHVELRGRRYYDREAAQSMLAEMQAGREVVATRGKFADNQERARVLDVYADAIAALRKHMRQMER